MSEDKPHCYREVGYLEFLSCFAYHIGLTPCKELKKENFSVGKSYVLFGWFVIVLNVVGSCSSLAGRVIFVYANLPTTVVLVDGLSLVMLMISNVMVVYNVSVRYSHRISDFLRTISLLDKRTAVKAEWAKNKVRKCYLELSFGHVFVVLFYMYDAYFWTTNLGWTSFVNYIFRSFQNYFCFIEVLVVRNYVLLLKYRFENLNQMISEHLSKMCRVLNTCSSLKASSYGSPGVHHFAKMYTLLSDEVAVINKVFGYPMLFVSLHFLCELLHSLIFCIVFFFSKTSNLDGIQFGVDLLMLCSFWTIKDFVSILPKYSVVLGSLILICI